MLALEPAPVLAFRETLKFTLELGSVDWLKEANSPSWLNLNFVVWAEMASGASTIRVSSGTTSKRFISALLFPRIGSPPSGLNAWVMRSGRDCLPAALEFQEFFQNGLEKWN